MLECQLGSGGYLRSCTRRSPKASTSRSGRFEAPFPRAIDATDRLTRRSHIFYKDVELFGGQSVVDKVASGL